MTCDQGRADKVPINHLSLSSLSGASYHLLSRLWERKVSLSGPPAGLTPGRSSRWRACGWIRVWALPALVSALPRQTEAWGEAVPAQESGAGSTWPLAPCWGVTAGPAGGLAAGGTVTSVGPAFLLAPVSLRLK